MNLQAPFRIHRIVGLLLVTLMCGFPSVLFARAIDDIRVSKIGSISSVEIEFECALRYARHEQNRGGTELYIHLEQGPDCRLALRNIASDLRRPLNGRLAHVLEVEFGKNSDDSTFLIVRFDRSLGYNVRQSPNHHMLTIDVDSSVQTTVAERSVTEDAVVGSASQQRPDGTRRVSNASAQNNNAYVIRLAEWDPDQTLDFAPLARYRAKVMYTNDVAVGQRRWAILKLGFFDTEIEAKRAQQSLVADYPNAWVTIANPDEQLAARQSQIRWPRLTAAPAVPAAAASEETTPDEDVRVATMPAERIPILMNEARAAMLRKNFAVSIELYERLLREPGQQHRRQAREFLGVARQKNQQPELAQAQFEAYLDEFPAGPDAHRVRQRLNALTTIAASTGPNTGDTPTTMANRGSAETPIRDRQVSNWDIYGSASQFYLRGVNLAEGDDDDFIAQSAMLSQAHIIAKRRGERFDLMARANLGYLYDFVENGSDPQVLVSYAFLDVADTRTEVRLRIGRQQQLSTGLLGRFDGLHASYQFRPDLTFNVTAGFPVDSPRFQATGDHYAYGASVDINDIIGDWDLSLYANQQLIDGIKDRQAVGAKALFQGETMTIVGLIDYDASFNVVNTGLISATWRAHDRITLHGRVRGGVAPFLTTRNAIIGQPVNTLRELFNSFTEGQIRRLARNRTADERFASGGLSAAITPRLQLRFDTSYLEYSATVGSGGVAAFVDTGPQYTYGGHLQGAGFFGAGQIAQLGYRRTETKSIDDDNLWLDLRIPIGERLRVQARLAYSKRVANQNPAGDINQWVANPLLRFVFSGRRSFRLEFEAGGQWSNREFPMALMPPLIVDGTLQQNDYYVQLGYTLDF